MGVGTLLCAVDMHSVSLEEIEAHIEKTSREEGSKQSIFSFFSIIIWHYVLYLKRQWSVVQWPIDPQKTEIFER